MQVRTQFSPAWERNIVGQKDILLKDYFTPDIFADAINAILYDGKSVVTPERMRTIDIETQHVEERDGDIRADARFRDLAKIVEVDDAIYCLFAIEHQSVEDYRMHLFEPGTVKEEDLEKFKTELKDVIAYMKYSKSTEALKGYNEKYNPDLTKSTVTLINELTNSKYVFIDGKGRLNMCEAFEGLIEEGRAKGKAEELKEKYKSWVTLSNNLKKRGMSNPEIASLLGVPETELQKAFKMIKEEKNRKNEYEMKM